MYPLAILFTMSNAALYAAESECRCFLKIKLRTRAKMLRKGSMGYFWFIMTFSLQFSVKQRFFLLIILSLVPPFPFQSHFRFTVPLLALSLGETSFCHWYMDKVQSCKVTPGGPVCWFSQCRGGVKGNKDRGREEQNHLHAATEISSWALRQRWRSVWTRLWAFKYKNKMEVHKKEAQSPLVIRCLQ